MNVRDQIRTFIVDDLGWQGDATELRDDSPLIEQRILDSIQVLTLVQFLEREYAIDIKDHEISADHLGSLASIEKYVEHKRSVGND